MLATLWLAAGCAVTGGSAQPDGRAELEQGIELVRAWQLERGSEALRAALGHLPPGSRDRAEALRWLGEARERGGDPEGALAEYGRALELTPLDPWLHYASGVSWSRMGELERARGCFTRALELDPRHVKALQWRGQALLLLGEPAGAVADLTRSIELVEQADEAALAAWGASRRELLLESLRLRIEAAQVLGDFAGAERDRERCAEMMGEP